MDGGEARVGRNRQFRIPGLDVPEHLPGSPARQNTRDYWREQIRLELRDRPAQAMAAAEEALRNYPGDGPLMLLGTLALLAAEKPVRALGSLKEFHKRYQPNRMAALLTALALAQQGKMPRARATLRQNQIRTLGDAKRWFIGGDTMVEWLGGWLKRIHADEKRLDKRWPGPPRSAPARIEPVQSADATLPSLPRIEPEFGVRFEFTNSEAVQIDGNGADSEWFRLRAELEQLSLVQGFDELLCLAGLKDVEAHGYQIDTVRKVLRQFRGRVLLADEVGLGKTVEAGMVLREYMLRGMAERMLILVPASLVGQWRDEMAGKFGIDFATVHDSLLRQDPKRFWAQRRVIASIATARRKEHAAILTEYSYDVVVVDEAHHLRNPASASYGLVNALQKRFLLLLSATPVQNDLLEIYHLLTLLQPGIFKTQKEFKAAYVMPGRPREPANSDRLRDLMRGVMVRNTRALSGLRLPQRHAATLRVVPGETEGLCYGELTALARELAGNERHRLSLQHLLTAAGSSPAAAASALDRLDGRGAASAEWQAVARRYGEIVGGTKEAALISLLERNPDEKKMIFVHHRDSLARLTAVLRGRGLPMAIFEGGMTGPQKDAAIEDFRRDATVLLCSESGGEGHNLQFCNTLVNFDIPWNPMTIEQRIGRIDRIGQKRDVFIFNLVTTGTIEDKILRILDDKINMFELVVGEVGAILGEIDDDQDFSSMVLDAWLQSTVETPERGFAALEQRLVAARHRYDGVKQLDEALFGDALDAA